MPQPTDRYLKEAVRLREKAQDTQDSTIRAELLAMAFQYEALAESVEPRREN
jgi:hypothetical protein